METEDRSRLEVIVSRVWELAEPVIHAEGMELVEVEYRREPHGWVLRLYIDQERGITVDDCARISQVEGDLLDVADVIPNPYHLEVSSPGLNRPLRKPEHFMGQLGNVIEVRTLAPMENRRNFKGILLEASTERIALNCDGQVFEIQMSLLERARLRYFESLEKAGIPEK